MDGRKEESGCAKMGRVFRREEADTGEDGDGLKRAGRVATFEDDEDKDGFAGRMQVTGVGGAR